MNHCVLIKQYSEHIEKFTHFAELLGVGVIFLHDAVNELNTQTRSMQ